MQKSQVGRFIVTAIIVFVILSVFALFLAAALRVGAPAFLDMAWNWVLRLVGLTMVIYSIIALLAAGPVSLAPERFSKWIALTLLGLFIIQQSWFLALGLASLLIAMMIITYLKDSGDFAGTQE